jgi:hypothetical protein
MLKNTFRNNPSPRKLILDQTKQEELIKEIEEEKVIEETSKEVESVEEVVQEAVEPKPKNKKKVEK